VTPTFIYKALCGKPLPLEGAGETTRDFIFVDDIVRGLWACAERGEPGDVYNLASGVETSIATLAATINALTGNPAPVTALPRRDWDRSGHRFGSPAKSRERLGFEARVPLEDGLRRTVAWTREHLELIEACIARHRDRMAATVPA
jgi:nucleoside-diphosphate-sugar epimerase